MNKPSILVVEDDVPVRCLITTTLKTHGYKYLTASNGETAIMMTTSHNPDIMLLDLGLPDIDGIEVIRSVRTWSNLPIIVLSARSEDSDKIEALDNGADDYLTKPFSPIELVARVQALFRRISMDKVEKVEKVTFGNIKIDVTKKQAYVDDEEIALTPLEFDFLKYLIQKNNQAISREELLKEVWKIAYDIDTRATDDTVKRLRRKIADSNVEIKTVWGYGFKMALKK